MYRFLEILPGMLAWSTLLLMVLFSWLLPEAVAIFIIAFDIYWLLKTIYLSFHLRVTFKRMKENLNIKWLEKLKQEKSGKWEGIHHLVILPMYQEPFTVVKESFKSIAAAEYPKDRLIVILGTEERGGSETQETAQKIEQEFGKKFYKFLITTHPENLHGEIPGKGSNQVWGAKEAKKRLIDPLRIPYKDIIVSVFDIDTQVPSEYFGRLTHAFLTSEHRLRAVYQPIPFFWNNIYQAPAAARVVAFSATFWQMMQQARPERLTTFSSQSLPFQVLLDIGFWHANVVSEDSRIFWQGYLRYSGDFRVVPLHYPVFMDANVAPTFWKTMKNLYRQQRRWGWGVENIPYLLTGFLNNPRVPRFKKWYWSFNIVEGFHSWATNSLLIFALGWLPIIIGGRHFNDTLLAYKLPEITGFIIELSMIGIATSAILGILLLPPRPAWFRIRHYVLYAIQWFLIPLTLVFLGTIPALDAQTRLMFGGRLRLGFWVTPKGRYK